MIAYKGFEFGLSCRGFQYEIGKSYCTPYGEAQKCRVGFHACVMPLHVLKHYEKGVYRKVYLSTEDLDVTDKLQEDDSKICGSRICITDGDYIDDLYKEQGIVMERILRNCFKRFVNPLYSGVPVWYKILGNCAKSYNDAFLQYTNLLSGRSNSYIDKNDTVFACFLNEELFRTKMMAITDNFWTCLVVHFETTCTTHKGFYNTLDTMTDPSSDPSSDL